MLLLTAAGISLGASAVAWWNRRKTKKVVREIRELHSERERIIREHQDKKLEIAAPYLERLGALIQSELEIRRDIRPELESALRKAQEATKDNFGSRESESFIRVLFELEMAVGRLNAEIAYLQRQVARLGTVSERNIWIPDPSIIDMPEDHPREGGLVQLSESDRHLLGYQLSYEDVPAGSKPGNLYALFDVDHKVQRARACAARGQLLAAALGGGDRNVSATVVDRTPSGLGLDYLGVPLKVDTTYMETAHRLVPGDEIDVYPKSWTLTNLFNAGRRGNRDKTLPVSSRPRVTRANKIWSSIPVLITSEDLEVYGEKLNQAFKIIEAPENRRRPWKFALGEEDDQVLLKRDRVFLRFRIHASGNHFVFDGIRIGGPDLPYEAVRVFAELNLFIPGQGDTIDESSFHEFLGALMEALASEKHRLQSRREALDLRKLSLIYQDQASHEFRDSSVPIFVLDHQRKSNAWRVDFMILSEEPSWVQSMAQQADGPLPEVATLSGSLPIEKLYQEDPRTSTFTAVIIDEKSIGTTFSPQDIRSLVNPYEGTQQRRLIRALEDTILGEYESVSIRRELLGGAQEKKDHKLEGHEKAIERMHLHPSVFAIWGPPGTGKTTLIIRYLKAFLEGWSEPERPNILISAPTHVAVDEIMQRLLAESPQFLEESVRYGHPDKVRPSLRESVLHETLIDDYINRELTETELGNRWKELVGKRDAREAITRWFLQYATFHGTTLVGMPRADFALMDRKFDLAIIDEAGKAFGAEMLIPARLTEQLIVVGDHRQLPPTITEDVIDGTIDYRLDNEEVESILRRNAFRQLFEGLPPDRKAMLTTQYRMDPEIADAVSDLFYDGKVKTGRESNEWDITRSRLTFIDFAKVREYKNQREPNGHSQFNQVEMEAALAVLDRVCRQQAKEPSILVICPYKAQRKQMDHEVRNRFAGRDIEVTTVDAVQGGEADLVMLLMTRNRGSSRFLLDEHRFNVALSRSKEACIIFGDGQFLTRSKEGPMYRLLERGGDGGSLYHLRLQDISDMRGSMVKRVLS